MSEPIRWIYRLTNERVVVEWDPFWSFRFDWAVPNWMGHPWTHIQVGRLYIAVAHPLTRRARGDGEVGDGPA